MRLEKQDFDFRNSLLALLEHEVVSAAADYDLHARIRRTSARLNTWLGERTGWRVQEHAEFVRLIKTTGRSEPAHAPEWAREARDYELFTWILWFREHIGGRRCTLSQLAEEVKQVSLRFGKEGAFDWSSIVERRRLVRTMGALLEIGAVRIRDGSLDEWQDEQGKADALIEWGALSWHLEVAPSIHTLSLLAGAEWTTLPADTGLPPPPKMRGYRQILLGPALFKREDPDAYHSVQRAADEVRGALASALGWELEVTSSYIRAVRSTAQSEETRPTIPVDASLNHLVVLLAGRIRHAVLAGSLTTSDGDFYRIGETDLRLMIADLRDEYRRNWSKELQGATSERLASMVLPQMMRWGLLRGPDEDGALWATPLASRLDGAYMTAVTTSPGREPADAE